VLLVDAHHAKGVPGRKTDVWDCRWLRKLHTFGMLRGCFLPPSSVTELRTYWRHRATLVENASEHVLRMQKALEQMNLQLHKVISDITGVTGMKILRAIVSGERDARVLARLRHGGVKASGEEVVASLTGHFRAEHLFTLKQELSAYDFIHRQIHECDIQIKQALQRLVPTQDDDAGQKRQGSKPFYHRKNQPHFDMREGLKQAFGVDLTKIAGISTITAMTLLSECGPDLSAFATEHHFASWLALCPNHRITGGKVKGRSTRKGKNRLATALCVAAQSLHRSNTAMGAFLRRKRAHLGMQKAITATAHKLARTIYLMLTRGQDYVEQGQARYEQQQRERHIRSLAAQVRALGLTLIQPDTGEVLAQGLAPA
jgi:transposase